MNIYVYSDESGVFDVDHNKYFVYGGLIILGNEEKNILNRKYAKVEETIRNSNKQFEDIEIKSTKISNKDKNKIYRSLNNNYKFSTVIIQENVNANIWNNKKDKQRYLDFAYKMAVKNGFVELIKNKVLDPKKVENIYFYVDEHSTATSGRYELQESLEQEFKNGTYKWNYMTYHKPIFPTAKIVTVEFCDSKAPNKRLVRAADIIANKVYYLAVTEQLDKISDLNNMFFIIQPPSRKKHL